MMPSIPSSLVALLMMVVAFPALAADGGSSTNSASASTFESFKIIADRNIFNQNRSPRSARGEAARSKAAPVVQSLSLVGTMSFEKGNFAFFDGSRPEYKKPLKAGETIAGYEIKEIKPTGVKISNETNQFELKVGQQLRRDEDSDWQISSGRESSVTNNSSPTSGTENPSPTPASGSEDEALKRLMEKRAKELNQ
jgi:hypothetical protein